MSEARQIFANTVVLTTAKLAERASSVFLAFLISRILYATGLGVYSAAIAYYGLIAMAAEMGTTNFLVREIAKDRSKTSRYVVHLSVMATGVGAVVMALSAVALPSLGYSAELSRSLYVVILAIIPGTLNTIQEAVFVAHQQVVFVTYSTFIAALATVSASLYLLTHGYGVVSLLVIFVLIKYMVTVCYFFFIHSLAPLRWEFHPSFALTLFHDIKAFTASSILGGLFARPEILILSLVKNETQIGFYSAALKLVDLWYLLPQTYMINVFPVLSRSYHHADHTSQMIQEKSMKYLLAISLPLAVGLTVAAEPAVRLIYGPGFEPSIVALQVLAWNLPLYCSNAVLWRVLAARGQQGSVLRTQLITTCTRLVSGYTLIVSFGSLGAALATVANLLLHNCLLSFAIKRDGTQLSPWRVSWRFIVIALMMGATILPFNHQLPLWVLVPLAVAVYVTLVLVLKAFSPDNFALFRQIYLLRKVERRS